VAASRLGPALRSARERAGWSREALAYHSGLSWAAIAQIETGRRQEVRVSSLMALATALGVSVDYLVGGAATVGAELLEHRVLTYGSDDEYVAAMVPFLREGLARADSVLAVTARRQAALLREALGDDAALVEFSDASSWYRSLSMAANGYRTFVRQRFQRGAPWIRIVAEPVWTGWSEAAAAEWVRYESMVNMALASSPATIVCTYDSRSAPARALDGARYTHPEVVGVGDVTTSSTYRKPEDFLLSLG
jgi:transcriptional regulator with XRE-family HTH domain